MRMTTQDSSQVVVGDVEHEQAYAIEFNPFMASLLSDKLYTDKPLACWRELYANAHDESDDIKVRLPDYDDQTCMVWDNGGGLDKDELIGLFCTYGASNKRDTNNKIGGFGVGSKVLFSYTDSFSAFSVKNGVKTYITCYKNDEGMPTARILGHGPSDEQSGTCITWAVKNSDIIAFRRTALEVFARFKHKPTFVNEGMKKHEWCEKPYSLETDTWAIREHEFSKSLRQTGEGVMLVMGGIAYPVDGALLGHEFQKIVQSSIDLFAPIGAVQLAASREALSYDAKTVQYVKQRLSDVMRDADQIVEDQLTSAGSWYDREVMRESVVNPLPFLDDDHRVIPEICDLEVRTWSRGYRGRATPSRLKFDDSSSWVLHPISWEETRKRTKDRWASQPDNYHYRRGGLANRAYNPYDLIIAFPSGKGMPPGFTTRCAAFVAEYSNIEKVMILSDNAHKWIKRNQVPTDCIVLWDDAMHEKYKPDPSSPTSRTYARKQFKNVTVNEVVSGSRGYLGMRYMGKLGEFVPDEDDKDIRWFLLSNNDSYKSADNPGVNGRERELAYLCSAGHLTLRAVPKSYAKVLGGQFRNINKSKDEFHEYIDILLSEHTTIDGYVRSQLHEKYRDKWSGQVKGLDEGFEQLKEAGWDAPDWVTRFASIWTMNWFEQRTGDNLKDLIDHKKAQTLIEKELDKTTKKVHKYPLFFPAVSGVVHPVSSQVVTALDKYLTN